MAEPLIRRVWLRMAEIYGHKWTSAFGDDAMAGAGETWAKALRNMTLAQLAAGIDACAESSDGWPPTLPQFRTMCAGIPAMSAIRRELRSRDIERTPFARLVWQFLDTVRWRAATEDGADRLLREAYEEAHEHVMRGGALPGASEALPEPAPVDHGSKAMKEMQELARGWNIALPVTAILLNENAP